MQPGRTRRGREDAPTCWCRPSPTGSTTACSRRPAEQLQADRQFRQRRRQYRRRQPRCARGHHRHQHAGRAHRRHRRHDHGADPRGAAPARRRRGVLTGEQEWGGWSPTWMLGHRICGQAARHHRHGPHRQRGGATRQARSACRSTITTAARVAADLEEELEATYWESLDQMLARMDIVSVNCPHTPATYHLLSARRLKLLKPEAYVVNTARGEIIDENALARMIEAGELARRRARRLRARAGGEPAARQARARSTRSCCCRTWARPRSRAASTWARR